MEWHIAALVIFGILLLLMLTGMPVALSFMFTCVIGAYLWWGGLVGFEELATSYYSSIAVFVFLPLPLFILMGSIIFDSGVGSDTIAAVDKLLGRLPGRLSLVATFAGVILGCMVGISGGTIGIMGKILVPEMEKRGYHKSMSIGPVVGSGTLAVLIPPSALAVTLGAVGRVPIGDLLVAIIMPGLLMAALFSAYIIIRCILKPSLAPVYEVAPVPLSEKLKIIVFHIMPIGIVVFAVVGVVFIGVATPTEAGALGALACYVLAAMRGKFNWQTVKKSAVGAIEVTVMIFMILVSAVSFSRILAMSGIVRGMVDLATGLPVSPMIVIILTQVLVVFMGCFLEPGSIIMITAPIFVPIAVALGFDPVWYGVVLVINLQLGLITPPLGLDCYVMRAVAPPGVSLGDVFKAAMPFCFLGFLTMILIMVFPQIATWLPNLAH